MNEEMSSDMSDERSRDYGEEENLGVDFTESKENSPRNMQSERMFPGEKLALDCSQIDNSNTLRHSRDFKYGGQSKQRKQSQIDTKLCKSIQNNIEMYFKRDYTKLKPQKESSTARHTNGQSKKTKSRGPCALKKGSDHPKSLSSHRPELSSSFHRSATNKDHIPLSQRTECQSGKNTERFNPDSVKTSAHVSPEKKSHFARLDKGFSTFVRQSSVRKAGVSDFMLTSYDKITKTEKQISMSNNQRIANNSSVQKGLMHSQGNYSTSTSKILRPTKFTKSFKQGSKKELLTLEVNTPRSKAVKADKLAKSEVYHKQPTKGTSSPKSIKAKLISSTRMMSDSLCQAKSESVVKSKGGPLVTNMIKLMDLSESQFISPSYQDHLQGAIVSSFTELHSPTNKKDAPGNSSQSPLTRGGQRPVKLKSKFNRPMIIQNMEEDWKQLGSGSSLDKNKARKTVPGSRLDLDGSHADEKHRDYKLNNMFKMIEFLEKDQNLTFHRLKIRQQIHEFKTVTEMTEANPEDRREFPELDQKYTIIKPLGEGSFAEVRLAVDADTNRFAIKIYSRTKIESKNLKKSIQHEVKLLKALDHKNIIKIVEYIEGARYCYVVMEYGGPVSLREYLDTTEHGLMQETEAAVIFFELAKALVYLHSKHIYHRDLKLDNIMVGTAGQVKLVDFGLALGVKDNGLISTYCGTPCYMSPEIFAKKKYHPDKADVWSFGICLYRAVVGSFPFKGLNETNLGHMVKKGDYDIPSHISEELRGLIEQLLAHCPSKRPSVSEVTSIDPDSQVRVVQKVTYAREHG